MESSSISTLVTSQGSSRQRIFTRIQRAGYLCSRQTKEAASWWQTVWETNRRYTCIIEVFLYWWKVWRKFLGVVSGAEFESLHYWGRFGPFPTGSSLALLSSMAFFMFIFTLHLSFYKQCNGEQVSICVGMLTFTWLWQITGQPSVLYYAGPILQVLDK